jgi:hypothetical protein
MTVCPEIRQNNGNKEKYEKKVGRQKNCADIKLSNELRYILTES